MNLEIESEISQVTRVIKNRPVNVGDLRDWVRKIPWKAWKSSTEFHGQRSLAGYRPKGRKELDMTKVI